jgi:hypothetical protein
MTIAVVITLLLSVLTSSRLVARCPALYITGKAPPGINGDDVSYVLDIDGTAGRVVKLRCRTGPIGKTLNARASSQRRDDTARTDCANGVAVPVSHVNRAVGIDRRTRRIVEPCRAARSIGAPKGARTAGERSDDPAWGNPAYRRSVGEVRIASRTASHVRYG